MRQTTNQAAETAFQVLLYYCYTPIIEPEAFREAHHLFCLDHNLSGRIIIAPEGLNGSVCGAPSDCLAYMNHLHQDSRFAKIDFKVENVSKPAFAKLHVRYKPEIVYSGLEHIDPNQNTGKHLSPAEFKALKDDPNVLLLDVRSDYEHELGRFKNAHTLPIENFRDFPDQIKNLEQFRDKHIITYCTGGIKCEKASAYLLDQGFENVYQLHGGIIKYGLEMGGEDFEGQCYVFDNRIGVEVNTVNPSVISRCYVCQTVSARMVNCANPSCNAHIPLCPNCGDKMQGTCSPECQSAPNLRVYDGSGYYAKQSNGYNPYINVKR